MPHPFIRGGGREGKEAIWNPPQSGRAQLVPLSEAAVARAKGAWSIAPP